jgi:fumarate reductase subunit D
MASRKKLHREFGARSYLMAAMGYLGILCFVPLLRCKNDEYVLFHARQGFVLWMWAVLAMFALPIPLAGEIFFSVSMMAIIIYMVAGILSVLFRRAWRLPLVATLADLI